MTFGEFTRLCYLFSTPSVDLDAVKENERIKCSDHKLKLSTYERLMRVFVGDEENKARSCNMWMLQCGPTLVEG